MRRSFATDLAALLASSATQVEVSSLRNGSGAAGTAVVVSFRVGGGGGAAPPTTQLQSLFANGARTLAGGYPCPPAWRSPLQVTQNVPGGICFARPCLDWNLPTTSHLFHS